MNMLIPAFFLFVATAARVELPEFERLAALSVRPA